MKIAVSDHDRFRVLSVQNGKQAGAACTVVAHGRQRVFNNTFTVPSGLTIKFYVPRGYAMYTTLTNEFTPSKNPISAKMGYGTMRATSEDQEKIAMELVKPYEVFKAGSKCPDYVVTKFDGKHASDNMYGPRVRDWKKFLKKNPAASDIVVLRNRSLKMATSLQAVLNELRQSGYGYADVRCAFCLSPSVKKMKGRALPGTLNKNEIIVHT